MAYNPALNLNTFGSYESLLFGNYIPSSIMVRKDVFIQTGKYEEGLKIEDWEMWLRISSKYRIGFINEYLSYYRRHPSNTVNNSDLLRKDLITTFLGQKERCYSLKKMDKFEEAYYHHFNHNVSPSTKWQSSLMFTENGNIFLFVRSLFRKFFEKVVLFVKIITNNTSV